MVDVVDNANERCETILKGQIEVARQSVSHFSGPEQCLKCTDVNDRAEAGYAVCSDCVVKA